MRARAEASGRVVVLRAVRLRRVRRMWREREAVGTAWLFCRGEDRCMAWGQICLEDGRMHVEVGSVRHGVPPCGRLVA